MSEVKDPAIKLFGKTIPLPPNKKASSFIAARTEYPGSFVADDQQIQQKKCFMNQNMVSSIACPTLEKRFCNRVGDGEEDNKKPSDDELTKTRLEDGTSPQKSEELKDPAPSTPNPETQSSEKGSISLNTESDELSETNDQQEKTLKKPDKILPCPRCNSMDTKFCYYNNYNVNQPRYFCRNCQRYWTEGGTMRNVPVGSGRRKSKGSFCSHYRHILVSDADMANVFHHTNIGTKAPIVGFGLNSSVCESTGVERYLVEKSGNCKVGDRGLASNLVESGGNPTIPQEPCFGGPPWPPYPWNSPQWGYTIPLPTTSTLGPPHFPATFYPPPAYWRQWNFAPCPNSLTLGKHSREGKMLKPLNSEEQGPSKYESSDTCVWIPKTLRFDDPSEAARSKIWSALGIKHENTEPFKGRGLFRTLKSKNNEKTTHRAETSLVLQANPAALSRSRNFHESV